MGLLNDLLLRKDDLARLAGFLLDQRQPTIVRSPDFTIAPYLSAQTIDDAIQRNMENISTYFDEHTIILCNLNGSLWFTARILDGLTQAGKHYDWQAQLRFIKATSTTGLATHGDPIVVRWFDHPWEVKDKKVVIFEDIIDTGETLVAVSKVLSQFKPSNVSTIVLFEKDGIQKTYPIDLSVLHIENKFVFGSGLDDGQGIGRDAPGLWEIVPKG